MKLKNSIQNRKRNTHMPSHAMPAPTETLKLDNKIQEKMAAIQCHESELALTKWSPNREPNYQQERDRNSGPYLQLKITMLIIMYRI